LIVKWIEQRIDDGPVEIALSIFTPYAVYLLAESLHASGVLAVVACGLYLSRQSPQFLSAGVRLQLSAVWNSLTFIINGLVFVMIGLQLPQVLAGIREYNTRQLLLYGAFFSVSVILLRLLWMFPGAHLAYFIRTRVLRQNYAVPNAKQVFVIGWTGMRGVVALAAAIALPETVANGGEFPGRNLILFLTFSVILVTLVLQGLTLPSLIRVLGLASAGEDRDEEEQARRIIASSALAHLEEARGQDLPEFAGVYDNIAHHYRQRLVSLTKESADVDNMSNKQLKRYRARLANVLQVERKTAVGLRNEGRINDEVLRKIEHELDLSETRMVLN
jgi:CPA1 family monovalent cation:H+ antiporter